MNKNKLPVLFLAHGSPMLSLENNDFTQSLNRLGQKISQPKAILCISAHWQTSGTTEVTAMQNPKTIHDFYGFPDELYKIQYPAPGSPELALQISQLISTPKIQLDELNWGLDHGCWSVLKHMYPKAQIPVVQLSMDMTQPPEFHYQLGKSLAILRDQNILIVGSGNIVHNLRKINWSKQAQPTPWAIEFDEWTKKALLQKNHESLINDFEQTESGKLSVPTLDHYLPLLYVLGASNNEDKIDFVYEGFDLATISMRTILFEN